MAGAEACLSRERDARRAGRRRSRMPPFSVKSRSGRGVAGVSDRGSGMRPMRPPAGFQAGATTVVGRSAEFSHLPAVMAHLESMSAPYAVGWFTLALINAGLAQGKGRSGLAWWILSLPLGPVATFLIVAQDPVKSK